MNESHPCWHGSTYRPTSGADPIRCYRKLPAAEYDVGYTGPGWYFWDKDWSQLHGPFESLERCREALEEYRREG